MNTARSWVLGVVASLAAAVAPSGAQSPAASPKGVPRPGPDAVWTPPPGAIDRAHQELEKGQSPAAALSIAMQSGAASPGALAFARRLGDDAGYMGERATTGPLLTGMLYFPLRANENAEPFVIDAANRLVRPALDDQVQPAELSAQSGYRRVKASGELSAWPPQEPFRQETGAGGGLELIYTYPMRVCHACPVEGLVRVAYRFDAAGKYTGRKLLEVAPPPPPGGASVSPAAAPGK